MQIVRLPVGRPHALWVKTEGVSRGLVGPSRRRVSGHAAPAGLVGPAFGVVVLVGCVNSFERYHSPSANHCQPGVVVWAVVFGRRWAVLGGVGPFSECSDNS